MPDNVLTASGVSKVYRLYRSRPSKLMDFFGIPLNGAMANFEEYWALKNLTLDIARGSTVGVIGANGAGKSTLLRILAGVCEPTNGTIVRHGRVSPLLELGTGFHPDLTGHENIFASGLYLGMDRQMMEELYNNIVAFADIGEFLHRPVRTYSTGMYMRLAFAVATSIPSDIQVIDEVLAVGDAHFFGKCLQRFRYLQQTGRTTVLVSHDHSAILRLCSRCIWLDGGSIVADGSPLEVVTAYSQMVHRKQDASSMQRSNVSVPSYEHNNGEARITDVEFLDGSGETANAFDIGDTMTIRIHCEGQVSLCAPVLWAGIFRADGILVSSSISAMDGVPLPLKEGANAVDLIFDGMMLGPGEYTVAAGLYPELDLNNPNSVQPAFLWHRPVQLVIRQPIGVAMQLGVMRHPVRWALLPDMQKASGERRA